MSQLKAARPLLVSPMLAIWLPKTGFQQLLLKITLRLAALLPMELHKLAQLPLLISTECPVSTAQVQTNISTSQHLNVFHAHQEPLSDLTLKNVLLQLQSI